MYLALMKACIYLHVLCPIIGMIGRQSNNKLLLFLRSEQQLAVSLRVKILNEFGLNYVLNGLMQYKYVIKKGVTKTRSRSCNLLHMCSSICII